MKVKFTCLLLGDWYCYTVQRKEHWYSKWQYIYDGQYPRLFRLDKLIELHLISLEELDKYFRADNQLYHFVQTNFEDGITEAETVCAIKVLNKLFIQNPLALNYNIRYAWMKKCEGNPSEWDKIIKFKDICENINNIYKW